MKKFTKHIALLLSVLFVLLSFPVSAVAMGQETTTIDPTGLSEPIQIPTDSQAAEAGASGPIASLQEELESDLSATLGVGEKTLAELQTMTVDSAQIPDVIPLAKAQEKGHVNRLYAQEERLDTVVFQNTDGGKTTYIYNRPVKYVDPVTGEIRDKSLDVTLQSDGSYSMLDNSVKARFPQSLGNGVAVEYGDYRIVMTPISSTAATAPIYQDESVIYANAFGRNTMLRYQTQLSGVKEDIVLIKDVGVYAFAFTLTIEGLTPICENGVWLLQNSEGETVGSLGEILITDSGSKQTTGSMNVVANTSGGYTVTVNVPQSFLEATDTTYPVFVDPTTTIYEIQTDDLTENYSEYTAIIDHGVYDSQNGADCASANSEMHYFGYQGTSLKTGKIIYKLPDFYETYRRFTYLYDGQIASATLYVTLDYANVAMEIQANPVTAPYTATDPLACFDEALFVAINTDYQTNTAIPRTTSPTVKAFDFTSIAKSWARYNQGDTETGCNPAYGLMLAETTGNLCGGIHTMEWSSGSDAYYVIETASTGGIYYFNNRATSRFLKSSNVTSLTDASYTANDTTLQFNIESAGSGKYLIRSVSNSNYALYASGTNLSLAQVPTTPTAGFKWTVTHTGRGMKIASSASNYVLMHDGSTIRLTSALSTTDPNYDQTMWRLCHPANYVNLTDFSITGDDWISPGETATYTITAKTPTNAMWIAASDFSWSTTGSAFTVTGAGTIVGSVNCGIAQLVATHIPSGISRSFTVSCGILEEGTYLLENKASDHYMEVANASTTSGAYVQQKKLHVGNHARWELDLLSDGTYRIQAVHSDMYLRPESGSTTAGAKITQVYSGNSYTCQWRIYTTASGAYKIVPSEVDTFALVTSSTAEGITLTQIPYTQDSDYKDEWIFKKIGALSTVELEGQQMSDWCWVTSARMFAKHYYPSVTYTQSQAVEAVNGSIENSGGNKTLAATAMNYYVSSLSTSFNTHIIDKEIYSETWLKYFLDEGDVLYISTGNYYNSPIRNGGHATLLIGYVCVDSECYFVLQDPWPVGSGETVMYSYEELVCREAVDEYNVSYEEVWDGTVLLYTPEVCNTIPYYYDQ